uniref:Hect ubiquitin-protein ligase n=1 Tax=Rhizophora mucronata TaxID=61149 RepID=A0A2P2MVE3_RHIMU
MQRSFKHKRSLVTPASEVPWSEGKCLSLKALARALTVMRRLELIVGISMELGDDPTFDETGFMDSSEEFTSRLALPLRRL